MRVLTKLSHCGVAVGLGAAVLDKSRGSGLFGAVLQLNLELVLETVAQLVFASRDVVLACKTVA